MSKVMNDDLVVKVAEILDDSIDITYIDTIQEIINLCADEAIDAVKDGVISDPFLSIQYTRNSERYSVIRAIEKRMK